jgi:phosphohistidine swiveling domain-containing protein
MRLLAPLHDLTAEELDHVGGKAASLARLTHAGLPVPPGVALTDAALRLFLEHNKLVDDLERFERAGRIELAAGLRHRVNAGVMPPTLAGALRAACGGLGDRLVVRSSALGEDGKERSFAGQLSTLLNVRQGDALEAAVRRCWASLFADRVHVYRGAEGRAAGRLGMGVVIMPLIDARVSGVLFTMNPVTGSFAEMTLEAVFGMGEALVSGQVTPERATLGRPRRLPLLGRLAARLQVEDRAVSPVEQPRQLVPGSSEDLVWAAVPRPEEPRLTPNERRKLGRLGLAVERLTGCPQDVEWAMDPAGRLFLLQARPITAAGEPTRAGPALWTRRFIGERFIGPVTPMGWSIVGALLEWFIAYPETSRRLLGGDPATRLLQGYPYVNATMFRHLAFKLPGLPPPAFMMEFLPPEELHRWTRRWAYPPDLRVYRSILSTTARERRWQRFRWNPLTNHLAWDSFVARLDRELPSLEGPARDAGALVSRIERLILLLREYIKIHVISLLLANLLHQTLGGLVPPEQLDDLLRAPEGSRTTEVNLALREVALGGDRDALLRRFGHRASSSSWEIFAPRWGDDPTLIEPLLESWRRGSREDPVALARAQAAASDAAMAQLQAQAKGLGGRLTLATVRLARRHMQLREEQRFHFDRVAWSLQRALTTLTQDVLGDGTLARWLEWPELRELAQGRREAAELLRVAEGRRAVWATYAERPAPPVFLLGDEGVEVAPGGRTLRGLGISPGRATGFVRVLRSPEEAHRLRPGDVLVTTATDPGWTPLFLVAGALVLELGSMLSHGAVVAREVRLPAVVNVTNATILLRDGQRVTVDGRSGEVRVEEG